LYDTLGGEIVLGDPVPSCVEGDNQVVAGAFRFQHFAAAAETHLFRRAKP